MMFDQLCGVVERHFPKLKRTVMDARLFRLEADPSPPTLDTSILSGWAPDERCIENFRLPFDVVALEVADDRQGSGNYCIVLKRLGPEADRLFEYLCFFRGGEDGAKPPVEGARVVTMTQDREYLAVGRFVAFPNGSLVVEHNEVFGEDKPTVGGVDLSMVQEMSVYHCPGRRSKDRLHRQIVNLGTDVPSGLVQNLAELHVQSMLDQVSGVIQKDLSRDLDTIHVIGTPSQIDGVSRAQLRQDMLHSAESDPVFAQKLAAATQQVRRALANVAFLTLHAAIFGVLLINEPSKFVVKEEPLRDGRHDPKRIKRSPWRPHYLVLTPTRIRQRLIVPSPHPQTHGKAPHERRGHWRTFRADRFKPETRGKSVWVKAHWVGPTTSEVGPNRYTVLVDV